MIIGYDLDGTICTKPVFNKSYFKSSGLERKKYIELKTYHCRNAKLINKPIGKFYIITGRGLKYQNATMNWLQDNNIKPIDIFFMTYPKTRTNMIKFKSEKINELNIGKYYEDDSVIVRRMKKFCLNTEIVQMEAQEILYDTSINNLNEYLIK